LDIERGGSKRRKIKRSEFWELCLPCYNTGKSAATLKKE
jgi:hypothetical protein